MNIPFLPLLRRKRFYLSLACVGFLFFSYDFLEMRYADGDFIQYLTKNPFHYKAQIQYYQSPSRSLRYIEIGDDSLPLVVFIHGAPSSSEFWDGMLKDSTLLRNAKLLAVDRPGYGYSGYGKPETSVQEQARLIAGILKKERRSHRQIILHGSSYGGTVAARIAMDYPELVDGLLLQSASVAPREEKTYDISYYTIHWAVNWLVPGSLNVANHEKLSHRTQLELMRPLWKRIICPTIILHGNVDKLIYPINALYAKKMLVNARSVDLIMVKNSAHDLLWTRPKLLVASLLKLLGKQHPNLYSFNS